MKTICALLLLCCSPAYSQKQVNLPPASPIPVDSTTGRAVFQEVVTVSGVETSDLIARARTWVTKTYTSAKDVIQQYDPAQGILVAQGIFNVPYEQMQPYFYGKTKKYMTVYHTVTVEAKAGRVRVTIDGIETKDPEFSARTSYYPSDRLDAIEVDRQTKLLQDKYPNSLGYGRKFGPVFAYSQRSLDAGIYRQLSELVSSFKKAMSIKEKDW